MLRTELIVFSCLLTASCESILPVVYEYDKQCQSLGIIGVSSKTSRRAERMLSEQAMQRGGNTLLFGSEGLNQFHEHRARTDEGILDYWSVAVAVRVLPGETGYWGVALTC